MNKNKLYQKSLQAVFAILVLGIAFFLHGKEIIQKTEQAIKENNEAQNQASIINQLPATSTAPENKISLEQAIKNLLP